MKNKINVKFARSSGSGGQNVNKRSTKAIAFINISEIKCNDKIKNMASKNGFIFSICQDTRQQGKNKEIAIDRLIAKIEKTREVKKNRIDTSIPEKQKNKMKKDKKKRKERKNNRKIDF